MKETMLWVENTKFIEIGGTVFIGGTPPTEKNAMFNGVLGEDKTNEYICVR